MVISNPVQSQPGTGPRPINLNRDVPQVIRLLELVFGRSLIDGRTARLTENRVDQDWQPAMMWRLSPGVGKLALGYVWEENGKIVGNATILKTSNYRRYLVVNVAVHPDFRRRGIAQMLMAEVTEMVRARQGGIISLQVEKTNAAALSLYRALRYSEIGTVTTWRSPGNRLREIKATNDGRDEPHIRELRGREWQAAYTLDVLSQKAELTWPEAPPPDHYQSNLWRKLSGLLSGRRSETWVMAGDNDALLGLASIRGDWSRPYQAAVRVHPEWCGQLERPLLAKLVRRLRHLPSRAVRVDHDDSDEVMNELLAEARFRPTRTLTHMQLVL
jgi:ribosomal protein S18 acetylase RimI-like enzyme